MNVGRSLLAPGKIEVAPARRATADEHGVPIPGQQLLHAVDTLAAAKLDAKVEYIGDFLVDHGIRQSEFRNLRADHAARARIAVEYHAFVSERRQIARDGERGGTGANQRNALAVLLGCRERKAVANVFLEIRRDTLQAADGDRFRLGVGVGDVR